MEASVKQAINMTAEELVIADISSSVTRMMGMAARAAMRDAGRQASHDIWRTVPEGLGRAEAAAWISARVSDIKGFGRLEVTPDDAEGFSIRFTSCAFARFTETSGAPCGEQSICYFGFGLLEETLYRLAGRRYLVTLKERDDALELCKEIAQPREQAIHARIEGA
jgi:predicted hydrocarbon binding protein